MGLSDIDHLRLMTARAWKKANAVPARAFGNSDLFLNPGWSLLIELYIYRAERLSLRLKEVTRVTGASEAAALRWVAILEKNGWITTLSEVGNDQPGHLRLSAEGARRMETALDMAVDGDAALGLSRLSLKRGG